jgi:signal transduction histidine kinase
MFAASLGHELGNPIDAIRRYIGLALDHVGGDPVASEYLSKAKEGVARTLMIMHELVAFSQPGPSHSPKLVELHSLLEWSLREISEDRRYQGISIAKDFLDEPIHIEDRGLMIVLRNLYKNAAHAMKGRGTLTVTTWRENGSACIAIQDTGQGIPEGIKERIFEPFFSTRGQYGGTGIGLPLSREIVERCGGDLRCENVPAPNIGARFVLVLPRKTPERVFPS